MSILSMLVVLGSGIVSYHVDVRTSPGPLSASQRRGESLGGFESHADFHHECERCHGPLVIVSAARCKACHAEVVAQLAEGTALHGLLPGTGKCERCHVEHQGSDAVISAIPFSNIDHGRLSGFSLCLHGTDYDGSTTDCESCHTRGQFGIELVDCVTCHAEADPALVEEHGQRFGDRCISCHDGADRMVDFHHDEVYVLEDAHDKAECEDCHVEQVFAGTSRECVDCHAEPEVHADQFGLECGRCHTAMAWTPAELTRHNFRLAHGDEGEIGCEVCHVASYTEYTCYADCHDPEQTWAGHSEEDKQDRLAYEMCGTCHPTGAAGEGELYRNGN